MNALSNLWGFTSSLVNFRLCQSKTSLRSVVDVDPCEVQHILTGCIQAITEHTKYPTPCFSGAEKALKEIDDVYEKYKSENDPVQKKRLQQHLQRALINSQELGDEKIQIVTQMLELVENRARQMETHSQCFQELSENEKPLEKAKVESCQPERSSRRPRRQRTSESRDLCHIANGIDDCDDQPPKEKRSKSSKKKKRSKAKQEREVSPVEFVIDPNEPTYCLCSQVSYGEMIGCDNEQCPIEWFHFSCVGLTYKPKGKWYCPKCRGDNEKTMDKCTDKSKKDRRSSGEGREMDGVQSGMIIMYFSWEKKGVIHK
ncbi:hypothetical protein EK904_008583 [Melospiza melodia maxima]|nr:hypothetical protein EK904_008583 [Melospiza melodia maxima]